MDVNEVTGKVGFLESEMNRKSNSRLTIIICAFICVFAALVEGGCKVIATFQGKENPPAADWAAIAFLVGVLLLGNSALKLAQRFGVSKDKPTTPTGDDKC